MQVSRQYLFLTLIGACMFFYSVSRTCGHRIIDSPEPEAPGDLLLDEEDERRARAFTYFAWAMILEMEAKRSRDEIEDYYLAAFKAMPESPLLFQQIVIPWLEKGQYRRIAESLYPIAREHPRLTHLQLTVAAALKQIDRPSQAADLLEYAYQAVSPRPPGLLGEFAGALWQAERYSDLDRLLIQAGRLPEFRNSFFLLHASALYFDSLARPPENHAFSGARLERYRRRGREYARRAVGRIDTGAEYNELLQLHLILQEAEDWPTLDRLLARGQALFPARSIELTFMQINVWRNQGKFAPALEALAELEDRLPAGYTTHFRIGRAYLDLSEYDQAHRHLSRAVFHRHDDLHALFLLAYVNNLKGRHRQAFELLQGVETDFPPVLLVHSQAARGMQLHEQALELAERADRQAQKAGMTGFFTPEFRLYQALLYEPSGDLEKMLKKAEQAYRKDPDCPQVQNFLGYTLADQGRELERAEKMITAAVLRKPDNVAIRDSLAWVYFRQNRIPEALREINTTLRLAQAEEYMDKIIFSHAGDIYAAAGYPRLAVYYWRLASSLNGRNRDQLKEKIDRIQPR